jgi:hypothetical protein
MTEMTVREIMIYREQCEYDSGFQFSQRDTMHAAPSSDSTT